jgi:hypothetical protein
MTKLTWDGTGARLYETGVDHGVLYIPNGSGVYDNGVAWNGLTTVTESPSGAEPTALYADNIKYLNLISAEEFGATIEAYTYPEEFGQFDGTAAPSNGVNVGQQSRRAFGLSYRTRVGNDLEGSDYGYKLHLIYNATAAPSEKAYGTINDSPEAITFSWELTTTPVYAGATLKPTAQITIDSTTADATALAALEDLLYGTVGQDPKLPTPEEVLALFAAVSLTVVDLTPLAKQPSYNSSTHVVTLPTVTGVTWQVNGVDATNGAQPAMVSGETSVITVKLATGYVLSANSDDDWSFSF